VKTAASAWTKARAIAAPIPIERLAPVTKAILPSNELWAISFNSTGGTLLWLGKIDQLFWGYEDESLVVSRGWFVAIISNNPYFAKAGLLSSTSFPYTERNLWLTPHEPRYLQNVLTS
jgi:hypothetical protein